MPMLSSPIGILLILALVATLWGVSVYNSLVRARNVIQESWRQIDVELDRHYDLTPNLVEVVRGYASHEGGILKKVTSLYQNAMALAAQVRGAPNEQRAAAESTLAEAIRGLTVPVEPYPDLKSNTNYLELQHELADTEDKIVASRRSYSANVRDYNTYIESVPTNIITGVGKFERATYFEVDDPTVRQVPTVSFGQPPAGA